MSGQKNNKWLVALLVVMAGTVGVESALLYRGRQERDYAQWAGPWQDPFGGFARMQNRMDRFFGADPFRMRTSDRVVVPGLDLKDSGKTYTITADLPGLDKSDIKVSIDGRQLGVSGVRSNKPRFGWFGSSSHRAYGCSRFSSAIELPGPVESSRMEATYRHGILKITVPKKSPENGVRKVPVR